MSSPPQESPSEVTLVTGPACPECWDDGPHVVTAEVTDLAEGVRRQLECGACGNPWDTKLLATVEFGAHEGYREGYGQTEPEEGAA